MFENFDTRLALEELNGVCDPDPFEDNERVPANWVTDQLADALDDHGRATLNMIRDLGNRAFKRNGTLNINRIAAMTGQPSRTLYRRINAIKRRARVMDL